MDHSSNVKHTTVKLLEDNRGENLDDLAYGSDIFNAIPKEWSMKAKIDTLDFIKIKPFTLQKTVSRE